MQKYSIEMWLLGISSELEKEGKKSLSIEYLMKMLNVFEDIFAEMHQYYSRFRDIVASTILIKKDSKKLKKGMKKIKEKLNELAEKKVEFIFDKY